MKITNPNKIWFPKSKITKADIVNYYGAIARHMLPLIKQHPVTMLRYPDGITGEHWFHKETPDYFPDFIERVTVKKEGGVVHHPVCNTKTALVYLANQGCLTPHVWLSSIKKLKFPDRLVFDLDPSGNNFNLVRKTALLLREYLEEHGLHPFAMLTGSRGMHVTVPLKPVADFDTVRAFAQKVARHFAEQYPKELTVEVRKAKRGKRLFIDTARNSYAATVVAPYAVRAYEGAPVAAPIDWKEVEDKKLQSQRYTIETIFKRLEKKGNPWKELLKKAKKLPHL